MIELDSLTKTYGGITVVKLLQKRSTPDYQTYIGSGKVEEIIALARRDNVQLLIVNNLLKPKQMFTLGEKLRPHKVAVWDRVDLILKIFQAHAKTAEAKLQIKLAAIHHMGPRIFGMGMELMQQAGGTGTRGGAGETNIEIMKRHLAEQERQFKRQLEDAARTRGLHRKRRTRLGLSTASVVGYTNAGKSSLVNALTHKGALVADALFATLDTRVGKLWLPELQRNILLSDTIGFIQDLPPNLIAAFRSTLDETVHAELLLHVIDASDPYLEEKINDVNDILTHLNVATTPTIYVFNKIDLVKKLHRKKLLRLYAEHTPVFISCQTGEGLTELTTQLTQRLRKIESDK